MKIFVYLGFAAFVWQLRDADAVPVDNRGHPYAGCPVMRSWSSACPGRYMITGASSWNSDEAPPLFHLDVSADGVFSCCDYANVDAASGACVAGKTVDQGRTLASCQLNIDYCDGGLTVSAATVDAMCNGDYTLTAFDTYTHSTSSGYTLVASTGADDALIMTCYNSGVAVEVVPIGVCINNELPVPGTDVLQSGALNTIGPAGGTTTEIFIVGSVDMGVAEDLVSFTVPVVGSTPTVVYAKAPMDLDAIFVQLVGTPSTSSTANPVSVRAMGSNYFVISASQSASGCGSAPTTTLTVNVLMVKSGYYSRNSEQAQVGIVTVGNTPVEVTTPFDNITPYCLTQIVSQTSSSVFGNAEAASGSVTTSIGFKVIATQGTTIGATDTFSVAYLCAPYINAPDVNPMIYVFPGAFLTPSVYQFSTDLTPEKRLYSEAVFPAFQSYPEATSLMFSSALNMEVVDADFAIFAPTPIAPSLELVIARTCDHPAGSYTGVTGFSLLVTILNTTNTGDPANAPLNTPYGGCPALNYFGTEVATGEFVRMSDRVWSDSKAVGGGAPTAAVNYIIQDVYSSEPYICAAADFNTGSSECSNPGATLPSGSLACKADASYCPALHILSGSCFGSYQQSENFSWTGSNVYISGYTADGAPIFTCSTDSVVVKHSYCSNGYLPGKLVQGYNLLPYNGVATDAIQEFIAARAIIDHDIIRGAKICYSDITELYRVWIIAHGVAYDVVRDTDGFYFTTGNMNALPSSPVIESVDYDSVMMAITWNNCGGGVTVPTGAEDYYMLRSPTSATGYQGSAYGVNYESWSLDLSTVTDLTAPKTFTFMQVFSAPPACLLNVVNRLSGTAGYQSAIIDSVTPSDLTAWFSTLDSNYTVSLFCVETADASTTTGAFLNFATSSYDSSAGPLTLTLDTPTMGHIPMSAAIVSQTSVEAGNFITQPLVTSYQPSSVTFALPPVCAADVPSSFMQSAIVFVQQPDTTVPAMPLGPSEPIRPSKPIRPAKQRGDSGLQWWGWLLIFLAIAAVIGGAGFAIFKTMGGSTVDTPSVEHEI